MRRAALLGWLGGLAWGLAALPAQASATLFSLAIGHNGVPAQATTSSAVELHYADDDALALHELARMVARRSVVMALPDRATQARFPSAREALPPSLAELRRVLADLKVDIERASRAGEEVAVWLFYSGHGWVDGQGKASLTLADGALTQEVLYDEVLPALAGRTVHLMIDACHAEAMLRARDATAETVEISQSEIVSASLSARLDHLPGVGVVMASASNTQAHEWDEYQTGVFTHELLSGLRGGADVNGDGQVEYSELGAFLTAANRGVTDPRARLTTLVMAPKLYPRVPLVDLRAGRNAAHLVGTAHHLGRFQVEDQRGNRLFDLRTEPGFAIRMMVPADQPILLSNDHGESEILTSSEHAISIEQIRLRPTSVRSRGALEQSMRRGLFAAAFGPSYYQGFVDNAPPHLMPVDLPAPGIRGLASPALAPGERHTTWPIYALGAASLVASGVLAVLAARARSDYWDSEYERPSQVARQNYARYGMAAISTFAVGSLCMGVGYWLGNHGESNPGR